MNRKLITFLLALTMIVSLAVSASAAETTEARVPVTLTVVNTVAPISCTVPACLPVSLVDGYVVTANNAAITNTAKSITSSIAKYIQDSGSLALMEDAFPPIDAEQSLAIRYRAKVSASEAVTNVNAATVIFTIAAAEEE